MSMVIVQLMNSPFGNWKEGQFRYIFHSNRILGYEKNAGIGPSSTVQSPPKHSEWGLLFM